MTISTAAFISVCSASMMPTTATAKPVPTFIERSSAASSTAACAGPSRAASAAGRPDSPECPGCLTRENANGITDSETNGATAIPSATALCPEAIPTATASANRNLEVDSRNTSPP